MRAPAWCCAAASTPKTRSRRWRTRASASCRACPPCSARMMAVAPPRADLRAARAALPVHRRRGARPHAQARRRTLLRGADAPWLRHTEYAGSMFITRIDAPRADCSAGYAVEGVEMRIGSPDSGTPAPGERGDILIRGPGVMLGYYRSPRTDGAGASARRLAQHGRHRLRGRQRRAVHRRPLQGPDHPVRLQRVSHRSRIGDQRVPGRAAIRRGGTQHGRPKRRKSSPLSNPCPAPRSTPTC